MTRRAPNALESNAVLVSPGSVPPPEDLKLFRNLAHVFEDFSGTMCSFLTIFGQNQAEYFAEVP